MDMFTRLSMRPTNAIKNTIRSITLSAMLLAILVAQEELLVLFPNVSLTTLLIMVYASVLPLSLLMSVTIGYVILDSLLMGSLNPIYLVPMLLSWLLLGLVTRKIKDKPLWVKVLFSMFFAVIYGWSFIPGNMITQSLFKLWPYVTADLLFEGIMAVTNLVTVTILYIPLRKLLTDLYQGLYS